MGRPSQYPPELRERAVWLVRGLHRPILAVALDLGVHPETLRTCTRQDEADDGTRADWLATVEREELTARGARFAASERDPP
jgi:transposase-like protein